MKQNRSFKRLLLGLLLACCASTSVLASDEGRLPLVDDSYRDASLQEFLEQLRQVVKYREPESLVPFIYTGVNNGKRAPAGAEAFASYWRMDAQDTELWKELETILSLGGTFIRSNRGVKYCAPYVFTHFPDQLDIFGHGVAIEENVELKSEPSLSGKTLRSLSYHLVQVNDWRSSNDADGNSWIKVTVMDNGAEGYVLKNKIRSPSDYHLCFLQFERGWRIVDLSPTE